MKKYYCPYCGSIRNFKESFPYRCEKCHSIVEEFIECLHDEEYYSDKAQQFLYEGEDTPYKKEMRMKYGKYGFARKILIDEEVSKNPLFDIEKSEFAIEKDIDDTIVLASKIYQSGKNMPKCPTCNSTNISKISALKKATHAFAFGLFSNTAKSQFVCKNCGYKW